MAEDRVYEVSISVADKDEKVVKHLEGQLPHDTAESVAVDMANLLRTRSGAKVREIENANR